MIIIKVMGGLGNQLFQYALGCNIKNQKHVQVKYDLSFYENETENALRRGSYIARFLKPEETASAEEVEDFTERDRRVFTKIGKRLGLTEYRTKYERAGDGITDFNEIRDGMYLIGYWQSERYFKESSSALRQLYDFSRETFGAASQACMEEISGQKKRGIVPVSLHVRAGDYLTEENRRIYGGICTADYYGRACLYIEKKYQNCHYYVFSNDIGWAQEHIALPLKPQQVTFVCDDGKADWEDLYLMSCCPVNVLANSSYSWWAGYLNGNRKKEVICPVRWTRLSVNDGTICADWTRIEG